MNHWALVTGAAQRLGRHIALDLAEAGWSIVLHCRSSARQAEETAAEIRSKGVGCKVIYADLADHQQVQKLFDQAELVGQVRCLVNNASLFEFDSATDIQPSLFNRHMAINLLAPLTLARRLYQHIPDGETGVVVNLLDQKLHNLNPDFLSYTLSKSGLSTATDMLARELAPKLRIVGVAPGLTMISHLQTPEQFEKTHQISPLKRSSQPEDIARSVRFLVESPAITGAVLLVDGGQHLVPMARDFSMMQP